MQEEIPIENIADHLTAATESHYPSSYSNSFADTLYNNIRDNDILFGKIIQLTQENKELQVSIQQYKSSLPPFLVEWWKSKSGEQKLTKFLEGLSSTLQSEIDEMNERIYLQRGEEEVSQVDYEEQLRVEAQLKSKMAQLQARLQDLKGSNKQLQDQIYELKQARPTLERQYLEILRASTLIKSQHQYQQQQKGFIDSFFNNQPYLTNKNEAFYQTHTNILEHMLARKQYLQSKVEELTSTVTALDEKIEIFLREKRKTEDLKERIVVMHEMVKAKKKQLKEYQEKTQIAEERMKDLQRKLCDENMEKTIEGYNQLARKYQRLVQRSLHLLGKSLSSPNLQGIQRIVHNE